MGEPLAGARRRGREALCFHRGVKAAQGAPGLDVANAASTRQHYHVPVGFETDQCHSKALFGNPVQAKIGPQIRTDRSGKFTR